jgi:hypothetical protein
VNTSNEGRGVLQVSETEAIGARTGDYLVFSETAEEGVWAVSIHRPQSTSTTRQIAQGIMPSVIKPKRTQTVAPAMPAPRANVQAWEDADLSSLFADDEQPAAPARSSRRNNTQKREATPAQLQARENFANMSRQRAAARKSAQGTGVVASGTRQDVRATSVRPIYAVPARTVATVNVPSVPVRPVRGR